MTVVLICCAVVVHWSLHLAFFLSTQLSNLSAFYIYPSLSFSFSNCGSKLFWHFGFHLLFHFHQQSFVYLCVRIYYTEFSEWMRKRRQFFFIHSIKLFFYIFFYFYYIWLLFDFLSSLSLSLSLLFPHWYHSNHEIDRLTIGQIYWVEVVVVVYYL